MFKISHFDMNGTNFFFNSQCLELKADHTQTHTCSKNIHQITFQLKNLSQIDQSSNEAYANFFTLAKEFEKLSSGNDIYLSMGSCIENKPERIINRLAKLTITSVVRVSNVDIENMMQNGDATIKMKPEEALTNASNQFISEHLINISDKIKISNSDIYNFLKANNISKKDVLTYDPIPIIEKIMKEKEIN